MASWFPNDRERRSRLSGITLAQMLPIPSPPDLTEGPLTLEELQLATRNCGLPLEALRYDITPAGLHYLLVHFDIPDVDASNWALRIGGSVTRPLVLNMDAIRARPTRTLAVTLECAGNGRATFRRARSASPGSWRL